MQIQEIKNKANRFMGVIEAISEVANDKLFKLWISANNDEAEIYKLENYLVKIESEFPFINSMIDIQTEIEFID